MSKSSDKEMRLHEGELNVMELLWSNKVLAAKDISKIIKEYIGWEKNTTYTVIKRLINKGAIRREDPGFLCSAKVTKKEIQDIETKALLNKMYNGSLSTFINDYLGNRKLSLEETMELKRILHLNEKDNSHPENNIAGCELNFASFTLLDKLQFFKKT